mmetsp:Transcript_8858/g.20008  ORF Transcript_8858/g.20008 Transcript_8858/m.20008 type:complete len:281 (+) Transcript_8858:164-1006(+)|eukprot:CAMPEP_0172635426 /NCGR_PEP_ID=MMETSP1068-20121228/199288_1 /TAXON_ID=35684 /ORGANISM="Pseudopedinella elastica, Strain CCMP716" /LENGTH=280 /DNA_ID=CAMNT_0013447631 /DNA_START=71 /DNA_END=913 /DNA_ORIENTATION=-
MSNKKGRKSTLAANVASSAIGGCIHACCVQPFTTPVEATITQMQINGRGFFWNFKKLAKIGVLRGLYRSFPTAMTGAVPKAIIHYSFLNYWIHVFTEDGDIRSAESYQSAMIGFAVGASEVVFTNPLNFVKFRMQRPEWGYKGMFDAIWTIYREEGTLAFWKGFEAAFARNSICMLATLGSYKEVETRLPIEFVAGRHFAAGAVGGFIGSFFSYPFEMMRAAAMHNRNFYKEMLLLGPRRLFNGWLPGACRLILTSGAMGHILPLIKDTSIRIERAVGIA